MHGQEDAFSCKLQRKIRERLYVILFLQFHANTQRQMCPQPGTQAVLHKAIVKKAFSSMRLVPTNVIPTFASRRTSPCIKKIMSGAMTMHGYGSTVSLMGQEHML
jgi:hypothetical protein